MFIRMYVLVNVVHMYSFLCVGTFGLSNSKSTYSNLHVYGVISINVFQVSVGNIKRVSILLAHLVVEVNKFQFSVFRF